MPLSTAQFSSIDMDTMLWKIGEECAGAKGRVQAGLWNKINFRLLGILKSQHALMLWKSEKLCLNNLRVVFLFKVEKQILGSFHAAARYYPDVSSDSMMTFFLGTELPDCLFRATALGPVSLLF